MMTKYKEHYSYFHFQCIKIPHLITLWLNFDLNFKTNISNNLTKSIFIYIQLLESLSNSSMFAGLPV